MFSTHKAIVLCSAHTLWKLWVTWQSTVLLSVCFVRLMTHSYTPYPFISNEFVCWINILIKQRNWNDFETTYLHIAHVCMKRQCARIVTFTKTKCDAVTSEVEHDSMCHSSGNKEGDTHTQLKKMNWNVIYMDFQFIAFSASGILNVEA